MVRFFWAAEKEIGMRVGVISDDVSTGGDFFHEVGTFTSKFSHDEEGRFDVVAGKEIKELGSDGGIGAVIKSDRELACYGRLAHGRTEELGTSINGGVAGECRGASENGGRGKEQSIHRQHSRTRSRLVDGLQKRAVLARFCSLLREFGGGARENSLR